MEEDTTVAIGKRVYVSNLSYRTSWQDLKDHFRQCGTVVYADVQKDRKGLSRGWGIVEFETPQEAITAIQTLNGVDFAGRVVTVREDRLDRDVTSYNGEEGGQEEGAGGRGGRGGRGGAGGRTGGRGAGGRGPRPPREESGAAAEGGESSGLQVVVQGIPWAFKWNELKDMFTNRGYNVSRADVVIGRDGRSRGYGTVRFDSPADAQQAIQDFNGTDLDGRTLAVKLDKFQ